MGGGKDIITILVHEGNRCSLGTGINASVCSSNSMDCSRRTHACSEESKRFVSRYDLHTSNSLLILIIFIGTGGVSVMALLISVAAGIKPIITSSSDEKLAALQKLHPEVRGLNYKTVADQGAEVKRLTDGRGVDFVVNNTGPQSLIEDIGFLCDSLGTVSIVGFLQGFDANWDPKSIMTLMSKGAKIK